jgi:hypothetical protein
MATTATRKLPALQGDTKTDLDGFPYRQLAGDSGLFKRVTECCNVGAHAVSFETVVCDKCEAEVDVMLLTPPVLAKLADVYRGKQGRNMAKNGKSTVGKSKVVLVEKKAPKKEEAPKAPRKTTHRCGVCDAKVPAPGVCSKCEPAVKAAKKRAKSGAVIPVTAWDSADMWRYTLPEVAKRFALLVQGPNSQDDIKRCADASRGVNPDLHWAKAKRTATRPEMGDAKVVVRGRWYFSFGYVDGNDQEVYAIVDVMGQVVGRIYSDQKVNYITEGDFDWYGDE